MGVIRKAVANAPAPALAMALFCTFASSAGAEQITLRLHTFNSPRSIAVQLFLQPWADEIEERTGGRVEVQVFPAMQLGGRPADLYGQARDGVVDIVWTLPGYSAGRFPLTEVFELPFVCGNAEATSQALHEFYGKWLRERVPRYPSPRVPCGGARPHPHRRPRGPHAGRPESVEDPRSPRGSALRCWRCLAPCRSACPSRGSTRRSRGAWWKAH